jgi:hypothetical protein
VRPSVIRVEVDLLETICSALSEQYRRMSSQASNEAAALCLLSRGVTVSYVPWKGESLFSDEDSDEEGEGVTKKSPGEAVAQRGEGERVLGNEKKPPARKEGAVAERFLSALGCHGPTLAGDLADAFATAYNSEEGLNEKLFEGLYKCLKSSDAYEAEKPDPSMIVLTPKDPSERCVVEVDGTDYEFAMCLVRKPRLSERKGSVIKGRPEPDHAWALTRRKVPPAQRRSERIAVAAAVGSEGGHDDCGPDSSICRDGEATGAAGGGTLVVDGEIGSEDIGTHDDECDD